MDIESNGNFLEHVDSHSVLKNIKLSKDYNIDECLLTYVLLKLDADETVKISFRWLSSQDVETSHDSGQYLDAFLVEKQGTNHFGHFGSLDVDWFARHELKLKYDKYDDVDYVIEIIASSKTEIPIGLAASWTSKPGKEGGMLDSWFGIDAALMNLKPFRK